MRPVPAAITTGAVVTLGTWAKGKTIGIKQVVGVVVLAVSLAIIDQANSELAGAFGLLVVLAVVLAYGQAIATKTGLTK